MTVRSTKYMHSLQLWYDLNTFKAFTGGSRLKYDVTISTVPAFQRGGTIVFRKERMRRAAWLGRFDPFVMWIALDTQVFIILLCLIALTIYSYSHTRYVLAYRNLPKAQFMSTTTTLLTTRPPRSSATIKCNLSTIVSSARMHFPLHPPSCTCSLESYTRILAYPYPSGTRT